TYLDDHFLQITRNFKKRAEESSTLRTLHAYLEASGQLLKVILQIPPSDPSTTISALHELLDFLDDLDQAWVAVLQASRTSLGSKFRGVDLVVPIDSSGLPLTNVKSSPPSQTDSVLEEWVGEERLTQGGEGEKDDLSATLERMGLLDEFDELFSKTLDLLGGLGGVIVERGSTVEDMGIG
ncbi:hypothetical protein K443DRAFT_674657, partial [Laccaria amethystina LaAM-08-1]